jgi:tetratricopeptide (TPR) repeat protein
MEPDRWAEVKRIVNQCLEENPQALDSHIQEACRGDAALAAEVRSLLSSYAGMGEFLTTSVIDRLNREPDAGDRLGPYQIRSLIGEGGMGRVYLAARVSDFEKPVAIKLVKRGMDSELILRRFRTEQQILARLEHPGIARLLDGGVAEDGRPYLVMEYTAGRPITQFCVENALGLRERLHLFRTACSAVQYAHQNLVIHRDLKPGNILVTDQGVPKLLDFGIAKLLEPDADTTLTLFAVMTPECASPEQARGEPVTTATDVYSLGVLLYQMLTGEQPYEFESRSAEEVARVVCQMEPKTPSAIRPMAKDLDKIVLKAMHKQPARRYASVEQFSDDVERYLAGLPVRARKDSFGYRASKFVVRHKASVAVLGGVALALMVALVIAVREAQIARRRFNDLRSLANSLIYDVHDSIKSLPGSTPARKVIVDRALTYLNRLAQDARGDPGLQREVAAAYDRVGEVQGKFVDNSLGDTEGALRSFQKALDIRRRLAARGDWQDQLALAEDYRRIAIQYNGKEDGRATRQTIEQGIIVCLQLKAARPDELAVLQELASEYVVAGNLWFKPSPEETDWRVNAFRKALAVSETALRLKADDESTLHTYSYSLRGLGNLLEKTDPNSALPYYRRELEIEQKLYAKSTDVLLGRDAALALEDIASAFDELGDFAQAAAYAKQALAMLQELVRLDSRNATIQASLAIAYANAAEYLSKSGDTSTATEYANRALEIMRAHSASDPKNAYYKRKVAEITQIKGRILMVARQPAAALKSFEDSRAVYVSLSQDSPASLYYLETAVLMTEKMGEAAALLGDFALATSYYRNALQAAESSLDLRPMDKDANDTAAGAYAGLGDLAMREALSRRQPSSTSRAAWTAARDWYRKSLDVWARIEHLRGPVHPGPGDGDPAVVRKNLGRCDQALSR